ncbi:hypothetical protein CC78DRAFT_581912 [Lojkania enalia]|uniref:Uncharacterized protein n=1 Tax=Lojkania enalia TaxID=147567 RepID=A0A9P4KBI6_9PLEO|nr:hypothetical protein CC78DRAFT_581912 [Didymosphaeria enalia]
MAGWRRGRENFRKWPARRIGIPVLMAPQEPTNLHPEHRSQTGAGHQHGQPFVTVTLQRERLFFVHQPAAPSGRGSGSWPCLTCPSTHVLCPVHVSRCQSGSPLHASCYLLVPRASCLVPQTVPPGPRFPDPQRLPGLSSRFDSGEAAPPSAAVSPFGSSRSTSLGSQRQVPGKPRAGCNWTGRNRRPSTRLKRNRPSPPGSRRSDVKP